MSKSIELLLECKKTLGIKTDYQLAKKMEIHSARISAYMAEKEIPDEYACIQMAIILKRNPAQIIAEVQADTEKNERKRAFWINILQQLKKFENEAWNIANTKLEEIPKEVKKFLTTKAKKK